MIIIEGPDNVGKTTAAEGLARFMGEPWHRIHMSKPADDFDYFRDYMERFESNAVYDRFHFGGLIYGHLLGLHPESLTPRRFDILCRYLRWRRTLVIVMVDGDSEGYRAHLGGKEEMFDVEMLCEANQLFQQVCGTHPFVDYYHDISRSGYPGEGSFKLWRRMHDGL